MANLNRVFLIGNLTRDPELRYTPQGTAVVNLRLAVNRRFRTRSGEEKSETCFVTVVVWDKQAESCNQYLRKGRTVFVEGRLQSRNFEDSSGKQRSIIEVRADRVQFLGGPTPSVQVENQEVKTEVPEIETEEPSTEQEWLEEGESLDEK
jgi:single-strand DNA-binding protein